MTPFGVVLAPQGVIQTPNPLIGHRLLAISSVILADMGPQGVIQGSKMTHFGVPPKSPFWRVRAETRLFRLSDLAGSARTGPKGVQKRVILDPLGPLQGPK